MVTGTLLSEEQERKPRTHTVKTHPEQFEAAFNGKKRYSVRKFDRDYQVGDFLRKREWLPNKGKYTNREITFRITFITRPGKYGMPKDIGVLGLGLT